VSPALVVRHHESKDGLREAVDGYVSAVFAAMLAEVVSFRKSHFCSMDRMLAYTEAASFANPDAPSRRVRHTPSQHGN
jgi:hypothetical protein